MTLSLLALVLAAALQAPPPVSTLQADFYGVARPDGLFSFEAGAEVSDFVRAKDRGTPAVDQTVSSLREIQFDTITQMGQRIAEACAIRCHLAGEITWDEPNTWRFTKVTQAERLPARTPVP